MFCLLPGTTHFLPAGDMCGEIKSTKVFSCGMVNQNVGSYFHIQFFPIPYLSLYIDYIFCWGRGGRV